VTSDLTGKESPMNQLLNLPDHEIKTRSGWGHVHMLYAMGADAEGPIKIGQTADVAQRVLTLQTGNPLPLVVFGLRLVLPKHLPPGSSFNVLRSAKAHSSKLERYIHFELHKMGLRMMGEWFDVSFQEASEVIEKSASNIGCRSVSADWLLSPESRFDPEIGCIRDTLLPMVMTAQAQAAAVNEAGLTFLRKCGHL
jgi:hypothetical protein